MLSLKKNLLSEFVSFDPSRSANVPLLLQCLSLGSQDIFSRDKGKVRRKLSNILFIMFLLCWNLEINECGHAAYKNITMFDKVGNDC